MSKFYKKSSFTFGKKKVKNLFEEEKLKESVDLAPPESIITYEEDKFKYIIESSYNPDIKVTLPCGKVFFIEVKGNGRAWSPDVRRKMLLVKKQHPELDIRFVFYSDGKFGGVRKDGSKQTQSEWAEKNGYQYAIGNIPKEWFE